MPSRYAASTSCCSERKTGCGAPQPPFQRMGGSDLPSAVGPPSVFRSTHQHVSAAKALRTPIADVTTTITSRCLTDYQNGAAIGLSCFRVSGATANTSARIPSSQAKNGGA